MGKARERHIGRLRLAGLIGCLGLGTIQAAPLNESLAQLKSSDVVKRRNAAQDLVNARNPESAPALLQAASDKDAYVRKLAIQGLGYLRLKEAIPVIDKVLGEDPSPEVRQTAVESLGYINDPGCSAALGKALNDKSKAVRLTAIRVVGMRRSTEHAAALADAAKDPLPDIRRTALAALGQIAGPATLPVILGALKDPDPSARATAALALGSFPLKSTATELKLALKDPDILTQVSAARSLAVQGDNTGFDAALSAAQSPRPEVRLAAIDALGWTRDKRALPMLEAMARQKDPVVRQSAEAAIKRVKSKR